MTELSHPQPQAMGIGLLVRRGPHRRRRAVVGPVPPFPRAWRRGGGRGYAQPSPARRPEPGCVDLPELEKEQR